MDPGEFSPVISTNGHSDLFTYSTRIDLNPGAPKRLPHLLTSRSRISIFIDSGHLLNTVSQM
jgi:hypothetical protein